MSLTEGQAAPCTGYLTSEAKLKAATMLKVETLPKLAADLKLLEREFAAYQEASQAQNEAYIKAVEACEVHNQELHLKTRSGWWSSPVLWGAVGLVAGATAASVIVN